MTPRLIQVGKGKNKVHVALARRGWVILDGKQRAIANLPSLIACIVVLAESGIDTRCQQVVS